MQGLLAAYLREMAARPFDPVEMNCLMFPAVWVRRVSGIDLTSGQRARSAAEFDAITGGDALGFATGACEVHGLEVTGEPMPGDIGIVAVPQGEGGERVGAIRIRDGWAVKTKWGIATGPFECLRAWSVPVRDWSVPVSDHG